MSRINQLIDLDESRNTQNNLKMQLQVKYLFNKRAKNKRFPIGDLVLMWNARV